MRYLAGASVFAFAGMLAGWLWSICLIEWPDPDDNVAVCGMPILFGMFVGLIAGGVSGIIFAYFLPGRQPPTDTQVTPTDWIMRGQ